MKVGYKDYKDFLRKAKEEIIQKGKDNILSIVLYGSVARNKARPESDIDILILCKKRTSNVENLILKSISSVRKFPEYEKLNKRKLYGEISPFIVGINELKENPLILLDIIEDGIILYQKDKVFERILKKFKEKLKKLKSKKVHLPDGTWYWDLKPDWKPGEEVEINL